MSSRTHSGSVGSHLERSVLEGPWSKECGEAFVVGITGAGNLVLVEDYSSGTGRTVIGLPALGFDMAERAPDSLRERVADGLRRELGYESTDLVAMRSEFGGGDDPRNPFFLAPLLGATGWHARVGFVPGVHEVKLSDLRRYLSERQRGGAALEPHLRQGLFLAEEFFPVWARARLRRGIGALPARERESLQPA